MSNIVKPTAAIVFEFSGVVREAFEEAGFNAISYDLLPTELFPEKHTHRQEDIFSGRSLVLEIPWDIAIFFPPCTDLACSGARWFSEKKERQELSVYHFMKITECKAKRWAIENPIGVMSTRYRKPDQIIQPWMFGHGETKATCLWLKNLPKLTPTHKKSDLFCEEEPSERIARVHLEPPGPERWKNRSRTYPGIAKANGRTMGKSSPMTFPVSKYAAERMKRGLTFLKQGGILQSLTRVPFSFENQPSDSVPCSLRRMGKPQMMRAFCFLRGSYGP